MLNPPNTGPYTPYDFNYAQFPAPSFSIDTPPTQSGGTDKLPVIFDVITISSSASMGALSAGLGYDPRYSQNGYGVGYPPVKP